MATHNQKEMRFIDNIGLNVTCRGLLTTLACILETPIRMFSFFKKKNPEATQASVPEAVASSEPATEPGTAFEQPPAPARSSWLTVFALIFSLMVGTAALPHILMRYYTTPSVRHRKS